MEKHVSVTWHGELDFQAVSDDEGTVDMGATGATGTFRPAALLVAGMAGCTGMDAISIMRKKRVAVDTYRVEAIGQQRDDFPRIFTSIVVEHIVTGETIDDRAVARAIELSARKYCAVGATLASGVTTINHRMRITDAEGERTCDCVTIGPHGAGLADYDAT